MFGVLQNGVVLQVSTTSIISVSCFFQFRVLKLFEHQWNSNAAKVSGALI